MNDILSEEEVEHLPPLSQSRHERMHEQYNNFPEEDDEWQSVNESTFLCRFYKKPRAFIYSE